MTATRMVALVGVVMKKVESMARAKKKWLNVQACATLDFRGSVRLLKLVRVWLGEKLRRRGRMVLKKRATIAKRKLAKVPWRTAV